MDESESTQPAVPPGLALGAEVLAIALGERSPHLRSPSPEVGEGGAPVSAEAAAEPARGRPARRPGAAGILPGNAGADGTTTNDDSGAPAVLT